MRGSLVPVPAASAIVNASGSLPLAPTALIGRASELRELTGLLLDHNTRLLTLTGTGGSGKTRLALALAEAVRHQIELGAWWCDLTSVPRGADDLVWVVIARVLGLVDDRDQPAFDLVRSRIGQGHLLLVLDNAEHVLEAAPGVSRLLDACPRLQVVVTSREPLRLRWERSYPVPSLEVSSAVALFEDRARAIEPRFALDDSNRAAVTELCERLDGLPLAIELAAARSRILSPAAMLTRLSNQLGLLRGGASDMPERHQMLRAAIAWSYNLLDQDDQALFRSLAVFRGGCTPEAVAAVCAPDVDALDAVDRLTLLAERSLLRTDLDTEPGPRFHILETLREYALEQLRAHGEYDGAARRHAQYFVEFAEHAELALQGPGEYEAIARLEQESDNLRAALRWAVDESETGGHELALRLGGALWRFWWVRGYLNEGARWLREALALPGDASAGGRAKALHAAGKLARERGEIDEAEALCLQSLKTFRALGDLASVAMVLNSLGNITGDRGDYAGATKLYEESLALRRQLGDRSGVALALHNLSAVARAAGDLERARTLCDESLALYRQEDDRWGIAIGLANLARMALIQGRLTEAEHQCRESLVLRRDLGDRQGIIRCLEIAAEISIAARRYARAIQLLAVVQTLRDAMGLQLPLDERAASERQLAAARQALDAAQFAKYWNLGRAMDAEQAIAFALQLSDEPPHNPSGSETAPLSARELEVARLVARGLTNRQIANELVISKWTADNHVANILRKLDLVGRAQVAAWLVERGLLETPARL